MFGEIKVMFVGTVVTDPEVATTSSGARVASFRIACNPSHWDRRSGRHVADPASYYKVACWRELAANVMSSVSKGDPLVVSGFLRQRVHHRADGSQVTYTDVEARAIGHDLSRGTAQFERAARRQPSSQEPTSTAGGSPLRQEQAASEPSAPGREAA